MENTKNFGSNQNKLQELLTNQEFIDFLSYKEDKWLQNIDIKSKLIAIFGNVDLAISEFAKDEIFNSVNFK